MKHWLMAAAALLLIAPAAWATTPTSAPVTASGAWIRVLPGSLPAGAYVTLDNSSNKAEVLVSASSPAYKQVMLHESTTHDGMSAMHMVSKLTLPAHGSVKFAPGAYHLMLMHAAKPVHAGMRIPITLRFADGRTLVVNFLARPANATGPGH